MEPQPSFVIVGSGVYGTSTAYHLVKAGFRSVTILDRSEDGFAAADAASNDLNKIIRSDYTNETYRSLGKEAIEMWRTDPILSRFYHQVGVFFHSGKKGVDLESAQIHCLNGVAHAKDGLCEKKGEENTSSLFLFEACMMESDQQVAQLFGNQISLGDELTGFSKQQQRGYLNPRGGWAEANNAVRALLTEAQKLGVKVISNAQVTELLFNHSSKPNKVTGVSTSDQRQFNADHVILCPGSWSRLLLSQLLPTQLDHLPYPTTTPSAQCVVTIQLSKDEMKKYKNTPVILNFTTGFYLFEPDLETGLMKIAIHDNGYQNPSPSYQHRHCLSFKDGLQSGPYESYSKPSSERWIESDKIDQMLQQLKELYPELAQRHRVKFTRVCWYSDTRDENWLIDQVPTVQGLTLATGDSGHGYKFLPMIGRLILARMGFVDKTKGIFPLTAHQDRVFSFHHHTQLAQQQSNDQNRVNTSNPRARL